MDFKKVCVMCTDVRQKAFVATKISSMTGYMDGTDHNRIWSKYVYINERNRVDASGARNGLRVISFEEFEAICCNESYQEVE